jgi:hypothetical protein
MIVLRNASSPRTDRFAGRTVDRVNGRPTPGLPDQGGNNTSNKNDQGTDEGERD